MASLAWGCTTLTMNGRQGTETLPPARKLRLAKPKIAVVAGTTTLVTVAHKAELLLQLAALPGR